MYMSYGADSSNFPLDFLHPTIFKELTSSGVNLPCIKTFPLGQISAIIMSYLTSNRFSRIVDLALQDIELELHKIKPRTPSSKIQDYMHLPNFHENLKNLSRLEDTSYAHTSSVFAFTRDTQISILRSLVSGAPLKVALRIAKIKEKTYKFWEALAEKNIEPYASFISECEMAQGVRDMELIQKMRQGGWKGASALWEILYPESRPQEGHFNSPAQVQVVNILDRRPEDRMNIIKGVIDEISHMRPSDLDYRTVI